MELVKRILPQLFEGLVTGSIRTGEKEAPIKGDQGGATKVDSLTAHRVKAGC